MPVGHGYTRRVSIGLTYHASPRRWSPLVRSRIAGHRHQPSPLPSSCPSRPSLVCRRPRACYRPCSYATSRRPRSCTAAAPLATACAAALVRRYVASSRHAANHRCTARRAASHLLSRALPPRRE
uniref:Uncharacterized protein n=1 Tax=Oryza sativa subsp. japonica TaxID=39947 RepID=Q6ZK53_ORYSJ|nr:hypothetical protein [Oryza sativa Japonica Group]